MQDYHKIRAWKMAFDLAIEIRRLTAQFPRTGYRSIKDQIIRSAESVGNNIVEGSGAATQAEFARVLDMSMKSASELEHQLDQVHGYRIIGYDDWRHCTREARDIRKMTWGLRNKVLAAPPPPPQSPQSVPPSPPSKARRDTYNGKRKTPNGKRSRRSPDAVTEVPDPPPPPP